MHNQSFKLVSRGLLLFGALTLACSDSNSQGGGAGGSQSPSGGSSTGGASSSGGAVSSGGASAAGGSTATGGAVGSGGAASSGGKPGSGGAASSGGKPGSGGAVGSGGAAPSGGSPGSGGSTSSGGAPGSGGRSVRDGGPGGETGGGGTGGGGTGGGGTGGGGTGGGGTGGGSTEDDGGTPGDGRSAGCGKEPTIPKSSFNNATSISITAANMQRRYIINVPTNYDNTKAYRLVVTLHARDGNDKQMHDWKYYGLLDQAKDDSIFVAPNGQLNGKPCAGTDPRGESMCGWPNSNGSDLALVDAVVAQMQENFCIDTNRIVATGWSYGGSMSYAVACERPLGGTKANWGVRAIAIYAAAQLSGNCSPSMPVAYYHSHGTRDGVLNYDSMGLPLAQNFAKANGCTWATPPKVTSGNHVCTNLSGCKTGYPLEFCSFNGDHTPFPDSGQSQGSWGPPEAWKFLTQF